MLYRWIDGYSILSLLGTVYGGYTAIACCFAHGGSPGLNFALNQSKDFVARKLGRSPRGPREVLEVPGFGVSGVNIGAERRLWLGFMVPTPSGISGKSWSRP